MDNGLSVFRGSVFSNLHSCFDTLFSFLFSGLFQGLSLFSDSVDFSFFKGSFFLIFLGLFRRFSQIYRAFLLLGSVLSSTFRAALSSENACY